MRATSIGSIVSASLLLLAGTTYAKEPDKDPTPESGAKAIVEAYLEAERRSDYPAMQKLFSNDARLKYTYEWGYGYDDSVYELDFTKHETLDAVFDDGEYKQFMKDYQVHDRKHELKSAKAKAAGETVVNAEVTETYEYQRYKGISKTKIHIVLKEFKGGPKITRLDSTTKF